ncbi:MAG: extracellular solute-binding protein [Gammaproteobacteria bacterium]|nr:extracellular solute-binding protein [Gammaproteobacteria bacterium]NNL11006.1 extracellular solute-binding protein [Pseudomonadales bacterium]NNM10519.1 extracellular solute-binding protein [Pseudomonadales bacterium]RZV59998.1 MAG: extracellular solute-binding protein [Pseudomonadales bacterium]
MFFLPRACLVAPLTAVLFFTSLLGGCAERGAEVGGGETKAERLVVYSSRNEQLLAPVLARYEAHSGVKVDYATDKAGVLLERIKAEGANSPADVLITVDAGTLGFAASQGLFQPLDSSIVEQAVPVHLRDPKGRWAGLSLRARTIVYSTDRVAKQDLSSYAALAEPSWQGRLCLRTSKKVYNQSLVAMLISELGEQQAERVVKGWVANLAIPPTSNDTKVMEAIVAGRCDIGIVNTYYFGRMQNAQANLPLALFWPDQAAGQGGVHVNVAGAGILQHAPRAAAARRFIEWLVSDEAQAIFAGVNQEYPVTSTTEVDQQVASWGVFRASQQPLADAWLLQPAAVKLMDRVGYR